jgi:hypothetical protein
MTFPPSQPDILRSGILLTWRHDGRHFFFRSYNPSFFCHGVDSSFLPCRCRCPHRKLFYPAGFLCSFFPSGFATCLYLHVLAHLNERIKRGDQTHKTAESQIHCKGIRRPRSQHAGHIRSKWGFPHPVFSAASLPKFAKDDLGTASGMDGRRSGGASRFCRRHSKGRRKLAEMAPEDRMDANARSVACFKDSMRCPYVALAISTKSSQAGGQGGFSRVRSVGPDATSQSLITSSVVPRQLSRPPLAMENRLLQTGLLSESSSRTQCCRVWRIQG